LVAVALAAFVIVVSYSFFNAIEKSGKFASENNKLQSLIPPLYLVLLKDFESINTHYGNLSIHRDLDGNLKRIEFYTESCYYYPGICRVRYYLFKNNRFHVLMREELRLNSVTEKGVEVPITERVVSFEVLTYSGGSWVKGSSLPRNGLIKLILKLEGGGELPLVFKVRS